ncbi:Transmembrane protein C18orf30 [Anas platyrhynchos]|uniref:Transmembrane protein C18orf30 n=1 Tax=Anas platyrhynchos TaxID=8839 RepID=R0KCC0_ANAPL|nr:Transmembrane protein C18orf30 [Anas platyrhynchos]
MLPMWSPSKEFQHQHYRSADQSSLDLPLKATATPCLLDQQASAPVLQCLTATLTTRSRTEEVKMEPFQAQQGRRSPGNSAIFGLTRRENTYKFHPTNKSPAAPRDAVIAAPTAASPGTAINAIPAQAVHTRGSEGLGPPFICFSTEPDILPGGQSRELRQHRNVQTRLRRATLRQGPVGSVPKTRPRARCRPSTTLSLAVCTELRDAEEEPSLLVLPLLKATTNTTQPAAALLAFSPILQEGAGASLQTSSLASCSQCVSRNNQRRRVGMPEQILTSLWSIVDSLKPQSEVMDSRNKAVHCVWSVAESMLAIPKQSPRDPSSPHPPFVFSMVLTTRATSTEQLDALEFSQHPALVRSSVLQLLSSYVRALTHRIHTWLNRMTAARSLASAKFDCAAQGVLREAACKLSSQLVRGLIWQQRFVRERKNKQVLQRCCGHGRKLHGRGLVIIRAAEADLGCRRRLPAAVCTCSLKEQMAEKQWIHFLREKKKAVNMKALVVARDRGGNTGACTAGKPQGSSATDGFCAKTCERQPGSRKRPLAGESILPAASSSELQCACPLDVTTATALQQPAPAARRPPVPTRTEGLPMCLAAAINVIQHHMDFYVLLCVRWAISLLWRQRKAVAEIWPRQCCFPATVMAFQYLLCLGPSPAFCRDHQLQSSEPDSRHAAGNIHLPSERLLVTFSRAEVNSHSTSHPLLLLLEHCEGRLSKNPWHKDNVLCRYTTVKALQETADGSPSLQMPLCKQREDKVQELPWKTGGSTAPPLLGRARLDTVRGLSVLEQRGSFSVYSQAQVNEAFSMPFETNKNGSNAACYLRHNLTDVSL